jgi:hypothetical protein
LLFFAERASTSVVEPYASSLSSIVHLLVPSLVASAALRRAAIFRLEALLRRQSYYQRSIDREVFIRQQSLPLGFFANMDKEILVDIGLQQPLTILGKR